LGHRHSPTDWLLLALLVAAWGSAFLMISVAVESLPPGSVVAGRLAVAALLLTVLVRVSGRRLPRRGIDWAFLAGVAVTGNAIPFFLISWGQQFIDSALAGILMAITPLATLVLAHLFVPGERLTPPRVGGFVLGFAGVTVLLVPSLGESRPLSTELLPQIAVLVGAVCYGAASVIARRRPASDALSASAGTAILAAALMLPVAALTELPWTGPPSQAALWAVLGLGVISTAVASVAYFRLIETAGPTFVALSNYLIPPWAVGLGVVFLGERPRLLHLVGLGLVLLGIAVSQLHRGRRRAVAVS
jgi:drug/metabolite transporter (DMT)-like permease